MIKKSIFSIVLVCVLAFGSVNLAHASTVSQPKYDSQTIGLILKLFGISENDVKVILSILYPDNATSIVASDATTNTEVASSTVTSVDTNTVTTVAPTLPSYTISTVDKFGYTFIVASDNNVALQEIVYKVPQYYSDPSGKLYACGTYTVAFPCITTNDSKGLYMYRSNVDSMGRATPFDVSPLSPSDIGYLMPLGTTIYYYKAIDSSGKVYEYTGV